MTREERIARGQALQEMVSVSAGYKVLYGILNDIKKEASDAFFDSEPSKDGFTEALVLEKAKGKVVNMIAERIQDAIADGKEALEEQEAEADAAKSDDLQRRSENQASEEIKLLEK